MSEQNLTTAERGAAHRLISPIATTLERMTPQELGLAREAFAKANERNCWYLVLALKHQMIPLICAEAASRGLQPKEWIIDADEAHTQAPSRA